MKKGIFIVAISALFICLAACGKQNAADGLENQDVQKENANTFAWEDGFVPPRESEQAPWYVAGCDKADIDMAGDSGVLLDGLFFVYDSFYYIDADDQNGGNGYRLRKFWGQDVGELVLSPDLWDIPQGGIWGMDVKSPDEYLFCVAKRDPQTESRNFYAVYTDAQGNMLKKLDLTDFILNEEIKVGKFDCDREGNLYIRDAGQGKVWMLNGEGEIRGSYSYEVDRFDNVLDCIHTSEGEVFFACGKKEALQFIHFQAEDGKVQRLAEVKLPYARRFLYMSGSRLCYVYDKELIGWDVTSGLQQTLMKLDEYEIHSYNMLALGWNGTSEAVVCAPEEDKGYLYTLSMEEPEISEKISVVNMTGEGAFLKGRVFAFSRENPSYGVGYEDIGDEDAKTRVLMELATGGGPDLLYLSRDDLEKCKGQGVLGDLEMLLDGDTMKTLLPGAVSMGEDGGKLVGLPLMVYIHTMITNQKIWQEDSWTVEDVLALLNEHRELQGLFADITGEVSYEYNMMYLIGMDIRNTPFCSQEEARFESPEFKEVLKAVKKITQETNLGVNTWSYIQDCEYLGKRFVIHSPWLFCELYGETLGQDANVLGFPTETGRGNYMMANGIVVVNQKSMDKKEVRELVNYLFGLESQRRIELGGLSVRTDVADVQVQYREALDQYIWHVSGGKDYVLCGGTEYLERYREFIRSAVPFPADSEEIFAIIMEECNTYFYGDKGLDRVAETIQKRVQLYLDERK